MNPVAKQLWALTRATRESVFHIYPKREDSVFLRTKWWFEDEVIDWDMDVAVAMGRMR